MTTRHTLLLRLIGPMQSWGYRSRFEDRDTGLEPTRSGVLGLLAAASGIARDDVATLERWDNALRIGVRLDIPSTGENTRIPERTGFRVETDWHTAQNVLRASGKARAETVLSRRHYMADARFTIGIESPDSGMLESLERALRDPHWTLSLGRRAFPLALPAWLPKGGMRDGEPLMKALKASPFPLLAPRERLPSRVWFRIETDDEGDGVPSANVPMRLADRPLDFANRRFGLRETTLFALSREACGMEGEKCFSLE